MKISKKLISAIVMLTLSFVMLVTSSFAWFAMNDTVTAKGMQVTAKADQIYLQILKGKDQTFAPNLAQNTVTDEENNAVYVPTNVCASIDESAGTVVKYTSGTDYVWVTANSNDPTQSGYEGMKYRKVDDAKLTTSYAYKTDYTLRLDPSAGGTNSNKLWASVSLQETYTGDKLANCVSVLIKCGNQIMLFKQASEDVNALDLTEVGNQYLTTDAFPDDGETVNVEVYVFFDGDNKNCTTQNVSEASYKVDVEFSVLAKA